MGDAKANESAVQFILQKCANLDARGIAVVKKHKEELAQYVNEPTEGKCSLPMSENSDVLENNDPI